MVEMIMLPGIGNSGEAHWQSAWQQRHPEIIRFAPSDWNQPDLADWVEALERAIAACSSPPVLVAHSLGCLLVPHWAKRSVQKIAGAVLVAVPDPDSVVFPEAAAGFGNTPEEKLGFSSYIIASSDDPYGGLDYARARARHWGSSFTEAGPLGHINESSGLGYWQDGHDLVSTFAAGL